MIEYLTIILNLIVRAKEILLFYNLGIILKAVYLPRLMELRSLGVRLELTDTEALLAIFHVRPVLIDRIRELQTQDPTVIKLKREVESGQSKGFSV